MVLTDVEFYELRYSGKAAAFLRGFRALYLGLIFNVVVMGSVSLAAIKFGEIVLGMPGWVTLLIAGSITLAYSTFGGLKAVIITDFVQFIIAMIGSIWACIYLLNMEEVGGLTALLSNEKVIEKAHLLPDFSDPSLWVPVLLIPLAVQCGLPIILAPSLAEVAILRSGCFRPKTKRMPSALLCFLILHTMA